MHATLYSHQFFDQQSAGSLASARAVLRELFAAAPIGSVVDVGCGVAPWLRAALELGADRAAGLDGDYVDRARLLVDPARFRPCDLETGNLRQAIGDDEPFALAMCMEVAEHLSPGRAQPFVAELCGLSDLVLFSAAVPGQGGLNHINEQWPDYWAVAFESNGFACFDVLRPRLWNRNECEWWYLQNVLLFARRDSTAFEIARRLGPSIASPPMPLVHPRMFSHAIRYKGERIAELEHLVRYQPFGRDAGIRLLETKVDRLRAMVLDKDGEAEELRGSLERARAESTDLHNERDRLGRENAAMWASTSWRVTSPLRRVVTLLRRRSGRGGAPSS